MNNREKILAEKRHVTMTMTNLVRYIAFGLVIATYSLFTTTSDFAKVLLLNYRELLLCVSILGSLTIVLDYFQFLSGYLSIKKTLKSSDYQYDNTFIFYKLRGWLFIIKQIVITIALVLFCYVMVRAI